MGYSNYLERTRPFTKDEWFGLCGAVAFVFVKWHDVIAKYAYSEVFEKPGVCNDDYTKVAEILKSKMDKSDKAAELMDLFVKRESIFCAFADDLMGEWLRINKDEDYSTCEAWEKKTIFDFVKTNRNQVSDTLVVATYLTLQNMFPEICTVSSDGMATEKCGADLEWKTANRFFRDECLSAVEALKFRWQAIQQMKEEKKSQVATAEHSVN